MPEPKFRAECQCGQRQPRWTTFWTTQQWMQRHVRDVHAEVKP